MKVVSPNEMSTLESQAYRDGSSESDFMEEAGSGVALVAYDYAERHELNRNVILLCGKGNNAGDAYVAGIHLLHLEYEVFAIQVISISECSPLCKQSHERFANEGGRFIEASADFESFGMIIDGLFGTGFNGVVNEPYASLIEKANASKLPIIAVDIPSGLNGENGDVLGPAIIANETAFLGLPKMGFFLKDGWNHVGKLRYVDFGLPQKYIQEWTSAHLMLSPDIIVPLLPSIKRNQHKYQAGYVVGVAGSPGMPGAAVLSSIAALRGGAGIVRLMHPDGMQAELASSPYEVIRAPYKYGDTAEMILQMNRASANFIGPGLGQSPEVRKLLREVLPKLENPCVIDADALNILASEEIQLPKQTIFTPHHGEMMRLLKMTSAPMINQEFLDKCRRYAAEKQVTLVLKGGPTFIFHSGESILVNPTGDPGMATAGSGDVLTGLLAGLLSRGISTRDAAALGVYLHGLAGEHAAEEMTSYGMMASDIIFHFPEAFKFIQV